MTIEEMFGDLYSIDIMAEKKTGEIVLFLICYGFIDGEEKTQRALLTKIEAYLKYTKLSWDEWMMNIEVDDMEDSIEKVAELLRERKI